MPPPRGIFLFLIGWLSISSTTLALHEDQVGKFDWHQKLLGPVRFVFNDPHQPKRLLIGTENNVVGAIHGNTGNILYRQLLETTGSLLYYALQEDRQTISVSIQEKNLIKIRTFTAPTGIRIDEWIVEMEANLVTSFGNKVFLINSKNHPTETQVTTFNLKTGLANPVKKYTLPNCGHLIGVTGQYLICSKGTSISVLNLDDGSVTNEKFTEISEILELSTSGSGPIPGVVFQGDGFIKGFLLIENSKSGPELFPLQIQPSNSRVILSQFTSEERPLLFVTRLENSHTIKMEAYNRNGQVVSNSATLIQASMPLSSLLRCQGYLLNNQYGLVGVTKDELVFGTKADGTSTTTPQSIEWSREESLESIVSLEMVDYPSEVGPTWNPYLATMNVVHAFISRVKYEIESLISGESLYASDEDRFGLRKVIVFVTKVGKVIGMDSSSGSILYSFYLPDFSVFTDSAAFLYLQRPAKYTPLKPQAAVIYKSLSTGSTILFAFDPVVGKPLDEVRKFPPILQTQMLHLAGEETQFVKPILLLDVELNVWSYPKVEKVDGLKESLEIMNSYFFIAKKLRSPVLAGFAVDKQRVGEHLKAKQLWNLDLGPSELLGVYGKLSTERVHSQGRVLPDRSVSYKYMNPNLVVAVTSEPEAGNINLFLVDAVSGSLIHSFWHKKCRGPVHVVHTEHWIVYSLYNEKNRRIEINSVELYEGQSQSNSTAFSSFAAPPVEPIVVKQSYIFPTSIQHLAHTRTEKGITNKDILIALPTGGVLELPRIVVQPRVSHQHYTQQMQEEDGVVHSIPYQPELPILSEMIFNYNQSVKRVHGIKTWPTRLESTCVVLVHGSDLYYAKLTPSKTFDVLKDDFDYWIISVALIGLSLAAYLAKRLAARKQLDQAWK